MTPVGGRALKTRRLRKKSYQHLRKGHFRLPLDRRGLNVFYPSVPLDVWLPTTGLAVTVKRGSDHLTETKRWLDGPDGEFLVASQSMPDAIRG